MKEVRLRLKQVETAASQIKSAYETTHHKLDLGRAAYKALHENLVEKDQQIKNLQKQLTEMKLGLWVTNLHAVNSISRQQQKMILVNT